MKQQMQATYDTFVEKAAAGRNTTPERIDAIAQGRVWTGSRRKQLGLVDELGGLDRALALAKQRAKIAPDAEVELVVYPPQRSFYELLADPFGRSSDQARRARRVARARERRVVQTLPRRCGCSAAANRWR